MKKLLWVCLFLLTVSLTWAQHNIRGVVKVSQGEPIIDANVIEKGTKNGMITDDTVRR